MKKVITLSVCRLSSGSTQQEPWGGPGAIAVGPSAHRGGKGRQILKVCDARILSNILKNEHPQTISLVLSNMESKKATEVISYLPAQVQSDVIVRMAHLERVDRRSSRR